MGRRSLRFGIATSDHRRAATWKCWTQIGKGNGDFYLACREMGSQIKVSFHQSGDWRIAFSYEFWAQSGKFTSKPANRQLMRCPRPKPIAAGSTLAAQIITPFAAVNTPFDSLEKDIIVIPPPLSDKASEMSIWIGSPNLVIPVGFGKDAIQLSLVGQMDLDNGEAVWIYNRATDIPNMGGSLSGKSHFLNGMSKSDLMLCQNPRVILLGDDSNGTICLLDTSVIVSPAPSSNPPPNF